MRSHRRARRSSRCPARGRFAGLGRLRSPAWAALLPGAIVVGTFAPLWHEALATALVLGAAVTAPGLALVALVGVVRRRRAIASGSAVSLVVAAAVAPGTAGQLALTGVTAFASLSVGVALARLIPRRCLLIGVVVMAAVDVLLLGAGVGRSAVLVSVLAFGALFGIIGAIIGVPIVAAFQIVVEELTAGRRARIAAADAAEQQQPA